MIKNKATEFLDQIIIIFPEFTPHDIKHKERVVKNFNLIIPNILREKLNNYEIFFLLAATYVHDIGMSQLKLQNFMPDKSLIKEKQLEYIREFHHLRTEEYLINNWKDFGITDHHEARIIGRIARGHRQRKSEINEDLYNNEFYDPNEGYGGYNINVPLLSAFLELADEFDLSFERIPMTIYEHTPPRNKISRYEWERHITMVPPWKDPNNDLTILCKADCKNHNIHRSLKQIEQKINEKLSRLEDHLHNYKQYRNQLPRKFILKISYDKQIYEPYDFRFSLNDKQIITLLMGEKIYENPYDCIRELLKNSIDSCRLYKEHNPNYQPRIEMYISDDYKKLTVSDNGMGMDEYIIEKYFTKIGQSFYRSNDFNQNYHFIPLGELGIGVLSYFMIAEKICIDTKMDSSLSIEIDNLIDYFFVKASLKHQRGTDITLFLKDEIVASIKKNEIKLPEIVQRYMRHVEIPIILKIDNTTNNILDIGYKISEKYIIDNFRPELSRDSTLLIPIQIHNEYADGIIVLVGKRNENFRFEPIIDFDIDARTIQVCSFLEKSNAFLSFNGVFIGNFSLLPSELSNQRIYSDINLKKHIVDLNLSRNNIIINKNPAYEKFMELLRDEIYKEFSKICKTYDTNYAMIANFFDSFINKIEGSHAQNLLISYYYYRCVHKKGIDFLKYKDLVNKNIIIIDERVTNEKLLQIFRNTSTMDREIIYICDNNQDFKLLNRSTQIVKSFKDFILFKKSSELYWINEKIKLLEFVNYKTSNLIEVDIDDDDDDNYYYDFCFNRNNPFIDLLIRKRDLIEQVNLKPILEEFFDIFNYDNSNLDIDFDIEEIDSKKRQKINEKQKFILRLFIENKIIEQSDSSKYELREIDLIL